MLIEAARSTAIDLFPSATWAVVLGVVVIFNSSNASHWSLSASCFKGVWWVSLDSVNDGGNIDKLPGKSFFGPFKLVVWC